MKFLMAIFFTFSSISAVRADTCNTAKAELIWEKYRPLVVDMKGVIAWDFEASPNGSAQLLLQTLTKNQIDAIKSVFPSSLEGCRLRFSWGEIFPEGN